MSAMIRCAMIQRLRMPRCHALNVDATRLGLACMELIHIPSATPVKQVVSAVAAPEASLQRPRLTPPRLPFRDIIALTGRI